MTAALQELLADERIWAIAARVVVPEGEESHYEFTEEGHISVKVETLRHGVQLPALLKGGDDAKTGVWFIPSVGTEVIVNFDDGMFEGDAYIVAIVGKGPVGLQPGKLLVLGDSIEARSESGEAKSLAFADELSSLRDYVSNQFSATTGHVHATPSGPTTTIASVPGSPLLSGPNAPTNGPDSVNGTGVFKGE